MRRLTLVALALMIVLPGVCSASAMSLAELQLIQFSAGSDHRKAAVLLTSHVFSSQTLGRALLTSIQTPKVTEESRIATADLLLSKGAWINYPNASNTTPLMAAIAHGHLRLAEYLLEEGANPDSIDMRGRRAIDFLASGAPEHELLHALLRRESALRAGIASTPVIMNIRMNVQEDRLALSYDLVSDDRVCVVFAAFTQNGEQLGLPVMVVSGDVGCDVLPGRNLQVVWDALKSHSIGFGGADVSVEMMATNY